MIDTDTVRVTATVAVDPATAFEVFTNGSRPGARPDVATGPGTVARSPGYAAVVYAHLR